MFVNWNPGIFISSSGLSLVSVRQMISNFLIKVSKSGPLSLDLSPQTLRVTIEISDSWLKV